MDAPEHSKHFPAMKSPMLPLGTFKNKVAFITGGGTGLGKGLALTLSALGASVAIAARRMPVLEETANEIQTKTGNKVVPYSMDVRDPATIKAAVDKCVDQLGLPDIVINNAAGNFVAPSERLSPNAWKTIIDIVLNGTAYVTLDIGKRLIEAKKRGAFLAVTTKYAAVGSAFVTPSAAAKSGVENLTRSFAAEWGRYGLRFNCIAPGPIYTQGAFSRLDPTNSFSDRAINNNICGRLGEVEEFANLCSYLVSDYANWMTGEVVTIDGGEYLSNAGTFNRLRELTPETWDEFEKIIRENNQKSKL